jgi:hypothetical protein
MSLRLSLAAVYVPRTLRSRRFVELAALTAQAFQAAELDFRGLSEPDRLSAYARWTNDLAGRAAGDPQAAAEVCRRLRELGEVFGRRIGGDLRLRSRSDAMRAGRLLYGFLRTDFRGTAEGEIIIRRCHFNGFYAPSTCNLMSALDEGILRGLAGGGTLTFVSRLTEGSGACRAHFDFPARVS